MFRIWRVRRSSAPCPGPCGGLPDHLRHTASLRACWPSRGLPPLHGCALITIFHDPESATSRDALALIRNSGADPRIVLLRQAAPSWDRFVDLIRRMDLPVRSLLRIEHPLYEALGLGDSDCSDNSLLEAMLRHPELIVCPIVETPLGVRLARPAEVVLNLLPNAQAAPSRRRTGSLLLMTRGGGWTGAAWSDDTAAFVCQLARASIRGPIRRRSCWCSGPCPCGRGIRRSSKWQAGAQSSCSCHADWMRSRARFATCGSIAAMPAFAVSCHVTRPSVARSFHALRSS
ncbi:ArsC/Spx/MgsR family protein [Pseudoroseomonas wenyumeiae]